MLTRYRLNRPPNPARTRDAFTFDPALDDSLPWVVDEVECGCGYSFVAVHRVDKYPVCPRCVITDRAVRI